MNRSVSLQKRALSITFWEHLLSLRAQCKDRRIRTVIDLLFASDLKQEFQTEMVCKKVNLSASRLLHLFHEEFGCSPSQALKLRRLHKARELLVTTFLTVSEVMAAVGLRDRSHFTRDFKLLYGTPPSRVRMKE